MTLLWYVKNTVYLMISCLGQLCPRAGAGIFAPRGFVISKGPGLMTSILPNNYSSVRKKNCYKRADFQLIFGHRCERVFQMFKKGLYCPPENQFGLKPFNFTTNPQNITGKSQHPTFENRRQGCQKLIKKPRTRFQQSRRERNPQIPKRNEIQNGKEIPAQIRTGITTQNKVIKLQINNDNIKFINTFRISDNYLLKTKYI